MNNWLPLMAAGFVVFVATGAVIYRQWSHDAVLAARVRNVQRTVGIDAVVAPTDASHSGFLRLIAGIGEAVTRGGLLSASTLDDLRARLATAGFRGHSALAAFVGAKLLGTAVLPLLCWLVVPYRWTVPMRLAVICGGGLVGMLLPDHVVRTLHKRHLAGIESGLPDALDMLVICSEAGLGLEPAIERVGREIGHAHVAVAEELLNVAREMRVNADRRAALMNMGARTGLPSLRRLGVTLIQTLQYGTPISQALRTLSAEMRQEALTRFEARAGRLPALLTVPMIVFILPCVFLIVGGPAIVRVMRVMLQ
ncbi:MAG TPA: type II secretion system F family protein [Acetobacteraceae bacterium]|nr:type II secretion system F family protein [Acetobacteraceae bacterium]